MTVDVMPGLGAVVLCGGMSRRMGRPKAWLPFGGEVLLQRVVRLLSEVAWPIVVVRAPGQDLPSLPPDVRLAEDDAEGRGPLQGLAAGLAMLEGIADAAFVSSTDAPFVEPALVRYLFGLLGRSYDVVVPHADGHHHPLAAVYGVSVRPEIERLLSEDRLRPFFLFERVRTRVVAEAELRDAPEVVAVDPELRALRNVNTPADYVAALQDAGLWNPATGS
jgi:molybdopterin-guanine dinucleotide biosynthesis protein A